MVPFVYITFLNIYFKFVIFIILLGVWKKTLKYCFFLEEFLPFIHAFMQWLYLGIMGTIGATFVTPGDAIRAQWFWVAIKIIFFQKFMISVTTLNHLNYMGSLGGGCTGDRKRQLTGFVGHAYIFGLSYVALTCIFISYQDKMVSVLGISTGSLYIPSKVLHV